MIYYIKGKITNISNNFLILENSGIGYKIITTNFFVLNEISLVYIYHYKTDTVEEFYGFQSEDRLKLFLELIKIKGVGCKLAINLTTVEPINIYNAIASNDLNYLMQFPKIGLKIAETISKGLKVTKEINLDLIDALENIGYKKIDILEILPKIKQGDSIDCQIKNAINLLLER